MAAKRKHKRTIRKIGIPENLIGVLASVSAVFACFRRIGLTNAYGDLGSVYYSAAFCLFFLFFVISGLWTAHAVSGMVRLRIERGSIKSARKLAGKAVLLGSAVSLFLCAAGYFGSGLFCIRLLHMPLSVLAWKAFLPALLPMTVFWILTGAMDGFGSRRAPDFVRFLFYGVLVVTGPMLTAPFFAYGGKVGALLQNDQYGPAYGAMGAALSMALSAMIAMIAAVIAWFGMQPALHELQRTQEDNAYGDNKRIYIGLLQNALPCLLPFLLLAVGMVGQTALYFGSIKDETQADNFLKWGIFMGKSGVLLTVPLLASFAFALRMLPELKIGFLHRNMKKSRDKCMVTLRCCALYTIPAAVLAAVLAEPLLDLFLKEDVQTEAVSLLRIGSISIVFNSLAVVLAAVLLAMDMIGSLLLDITAGIVIHLAALYGMLHFLELGVYALVYANMIGCFLLCLMFLFSIKRHLRLSFSWNRVFLAPCLAGAVMAAASAILKFVLPQNASGLLTVLVSGAVGIICYFISVILLKGATPRELRTFPGGDYLIAIARLIRLL